MRSTDTKITAVYRRDVRRYQYKSYCRRSDSAPIQRRHPINRLPQQTRDRVEVHLDIVLLPDPGGSDGFNICRLYSPYINTYGKFCDLIRREMGLEDDCERNEAISTSTVTRVIHEFLRRRRGWRMSFQKQTKTHVPYAIICKIRFCRQIMR